MKAQLQTALLVLVSGPLAAFGQPGDRPTDFAYGMTLDDPTGNGPLHTLLLPTEVYRGITRRDLGDLRVFNQDGQSVPVAIRPLITKTDTSTIIELPLFPIEAPPAMGIEQVAISLKRRSNGTTYFTQRMVMPTDAGAGDAAAPVRRGYVLDADEAMGRGVAQTLEVEWAATETSFSVPVRIEGSTDLTSWQRVASTQTLATMSHAGHTFEQRTLRLGSTIPRFLRVSWGAVPPPPEFRRVRLTVASTVETGPEHRQVTVTSVPVEGRPYTYDFDLGGPFPVGQIKPSGIDRNAIAKAVIRSSASPNGPWAERFRGLLYRVNVRGVNFESPTIRVPPNRDRYWRLEIGNEGGGVSVSSPTFDFLWQPEQLIFSRRGPEPFVLAYGSRRAPPAAFDADELLSVFPAGYPLGSIPDETIVAGPRRRLGTDEVLRVPPKQPWKKYVLWGVLIFGVALLAGLSVRLIAQLNTQTEKTLE